MSLRILLLAPQPFFEIRGTPFAVLAMARALTQLGHRVDLLSFPQGAAVDVEGLTHRRSLRLPVGHVRPGASLAKLLLDIPFALEAWARMAFGGYDVVHAVEEAAFFAAPVARTLGLPLVMDIDSSIPDQLRYSGFARRGPLPWLAERLERAAARGAASIITVCTSLTEGIRRYETSAEIFQIEDPPLVDPKQPPAAADVDALRRELGLSSAPVVFYSGNFEPYQGVPLLIEAVSMVAGVQLLLMGGEPTEIETLRVACLRLGVDGRCCFSGKRPPELLPQFLALADVVVSPRIQGQNTPFKIYTYLAAGRPLVATRIATHTQLLDDSLAVLTEPTAEALAAGIRIALDDPDASALRAQLGRALIEREYSAARYAEKVAGAYAHIADRTTS